MTVDHPALQAKVRCYGARAALTAEATSITRDGQSPIAALNLDVAQRQGEHVQWDKKITLQLGETELPLFAALCLGLLPKVHFKRPTKGIVIERQPNKLFVSATQGQGTAYALPIPMAQSFQLSALALAQLKKQVSGVDEAFLLAALRGAAALYSHS
ncbi:hypothetical protein MIH18_23050 (plasmid) [Marinobacter sp. M3C]|jgi:hypothetical protein|uniref:hypothetical protein n=1 Tax=Marinobacter sp. M3C TaxID=2917715 RepID=UPI00200DA02E|nr:hypothetical protein [Marinobacter sp. M3C]UQG62609.1 hypothetical protein MIH18_23050 [Marinobacter sp. M3C]